VSADALRAVLEEAPYPAALGVRLEEVGEGRLRLRLPYRDENANPGRALHGGCAASLAALGAEGVARAALGAPSGPFHACELQVGYLAAALGEDVVAEARLLRQGQTLVFAAVEVATAEGKPVATATATVRARQGVAPATPPRAAGDDGGADPGRMGPHVGHLPFVAGRGIRVEHMAGGRSRLVMPWRPANAHLDGGVHEGAVLALFDTTGAMAAWAETGPGRYKASTAALQAQLLSPPGTVDLVARGRVAHRDGEIFFCDVEVAEPAGGVVARGTVLYRIVT
jgi:uncharacterized protein (TIGR00369 family)